MAPDKIQDLESSLLEMLGTNPLSVHFAELALSYSNRYDSVHMLCTVSVPVSRNCINLPYAVVMNGDFFF
jgi:hypothetical protein